MSLSRLLLLLAVAAWMLFRLAKRLLDESVAWAATLVFLLTELFWRFTLAGLSKQGELNIDVLGHDACDKLARWFEERWNDRFCLDISKELVEIIDSEEKINQFLPVLDGMMGSGLVTIEKVKVLLYGPQAPARG